VPASADDPPPPPPACPVETVPPWCALPVPGAVYEDPPGQPVTQSDTGNSGTGALAEGEEATGYACNGLQQREASIPSSPGVYTVQWRTCIEDLPGADARTKTRATFFYDHPTTGRHVAYGNIRWSTSWSPAPRRRLYRWDDVTAQWHILAYTSNRADAIQVHSSVAYSLVGCPLTANWMRSVFREHYVRMPNGVLFGPHGFDSSGVWQSSVCV
jgi:hypothetical protein